MPDILPVHWERRKLEAYLSLASGVSKPAELMASASAANPVPVFGGNGIMGYTSRPLIAGPRLIIGRVGENCGSVHFADLPIWVTDNALYSRDFSDEVSPRYLARLLRHLDLGRLRNKGGQPLVSQSSVLKLEIPVPPVEEQIRIERFLALFESAQRLSVEAVNAKRRLKRGLMEELLTGRRRFKESPTQAWGELTLGHWLLEFTERNVGGEVSEVLSCTKNGIMRQRDRFSKRLASKDVSRYKVVRRGDLVYDPMLLWDGSLGFVESADSGVVSPAYVTLRFQGGEDERAFVRELLHSAYHAHQYKVISQGTNQRRRKAMPNDFLAIRAVAPVSTRAREQIGRLAELLEGEISQLQRLRQLLEQQGRGVANLLMTGKVRLPETAP